MTEPLSTRGVVTFALRVLGFSVVLFALWYLAARPIAMGVAGGSAALLPAAPVERARPRWKDRQVAFDIEFDGATTYRNRLRPDVVFEVTVNPLKQAFGLPFFLALLLASRPPRLAAKAVLGIALLWALAAFGVACEVAISVGNIAGPSGPLVHFNAFAATFAALGIQLGTLIFPTVVPAMLWVAMDPRYMRAAARRMGVDGKSA